MIAWQIATAAAPAQPAPAMFARLARCRDATGAIARPCTLPPWIGPAQAAKRLAGRDHIWWIEGDRLTIIARPTIGTWVTLCCSVQTPLDPLPGSALAAVTVRIPRIDRALLDIRPFPAARDVPEIWRGAHAPLAPPAVNVPPTRLLRRSIASHWLGETRDITVYLPPATGNPGAWPIAYLADDLASGFAPILEALVRQGRARPAILVGIAAARPRAANCLSPDCDRRGREYKPDSDPAGAAPTTAFGRHLRFVTEELIPAIEATYGGKRDRADRIVGGSSNGAHWALAAAGLRPDLFGKVIALSSSGANGRALGARLGHVRLFAAAGLFEPGYRRDTAEAATAARKAGATVAFATLVSGHDALAWKMTFAQGFPWLIGLAPYRPAPKKTGRSLTAPPGFGGCRREGEEGAGGAPLAALFCRQISADFRIAGIRSDPG